MSTTTIVWLVYVAISLFCYIVSTALAIKRKKATGITQADYDTFVKTEFNKVIEYILDAEDKYNSVFKDGVKAGQFKFKDVIDLIKEDCSNSTSLFDKEFWTGVINNIVSCMNHNKETSVQTESSVNVKGVTV